jgi:hypothetical protein
MIAREQNVNVLSRTTHHVTIAPELADATRAAYRAR